MSGGDIVEYVFGGLAACCAGVFTNPLEVIKTRLQLQGELKRRGYYTVHYRNTFHAFWAVAKAENIFALQKGLVPAMWYHMFMNGTRLAAFQCFDNLNLTRNEKGDVVFYRSLLAGACAGCIGSIIGSPFFMIKTQLQARAASSIAVGHQHDYCRMTDAFRTIYSTSGITGLWRGVSGAIARITFGSAAQLSTFTKTQEFLDRLKVFPENSWKNSFAASSLTGLVVVVIMTPFDVVCTRLYNQAVDAKGRGMFYSGLLDCIVKIARKEGLLAFYKGWTASLMRLAPHTVLSLMFWTEFRKLYGKWKNNNL